MKRVYTVSSILLAILLFVTVLTGSLNAVSLVVFGFTVLALIYALALWTVFANTGNTEPDKLRKI